MSTEWVGDFGARISAMRETGLWNPESYYVVLKWLNDQASPEWFQPEPVEKGKELSNEYLVSVLEKAKKHLPEWLWKQLHSFALPSAGGKARWKKSKSALADLSEEDLAKAIQEELGKRGLKLGAAGGLEAIGKNQPDAGDVHVPVPLSSEEEEKKKKLTVDELEKSAGNHLVPSIGPRYASVAFIGASPGRVDSIRRTPLVGPAGETLNNLYLSPLGLQREDVFLTNVVPVMKLDDQNNVREPTTEEVDEWKGWLVSEIKKAAPDVIIALGWKAKAALGDLADFVMPHPMAIRRFGDTGEVSRKMKQVEKVLKVNAPHLADETIVVKFERQEVSEETNYAQIVKADASKQIVIGVVLEPNEIDTQKDTISAEDIEAAAHRYLVDSRVVGDQHRKKAKTDVVESYIAPVDFELNKQMVKKGSWVLAVHVVDSALWKDVDAGKYTGFSVGGVGVRQKIEV